MYNSFQTIEDFIKEIYGFNFIKEPMDPKVAKIREPRKHPSGANQLLAKAKHWMVPIR